VVSHSRLIFLAFHDALEHLVLGDRLAEVILFVLTDQSRQRDYRLFGVRVLLWLFVLIGRGMLAGLGTVIDVE
jgi:hypothetical protein